MLPHDDSEPTRGSFALVSDRRRFMGTMIAAATAVASTASESLALVTSTPKRAHETASELPRGRAEHCLQIRKSVSLADARMPTPHNRPNGDEDLYDNKIGNHHKGLPHGDTGTVDLGAYKSMRKALDSGRPADFDQIILGGNAKLSNPQGGLAFDLKGCDSHQTFMARPPVLASSERAAEWSRITGWPCCGT
jgi:hypothetical protein